MRFGRSLQGLPARFGLQASKDDLLERQAETLRHNAALLLKTVVSQELELDAAIAGAPRWSDRWWTLVRAAGRLRTRRIELGRQAGIQGQPT